MYLYKLFLLPSKKLINNVDIYLTYIKMLVHETKYAE